jgi:hypothetical protein
MIRGWPPAQATANSLAIERSVLAVSRETDGKIPTEPLARREL